MGWFRDAEPQDIGQVLSGRRLPALDGLRAVAVFTVITYHFGFGVVPGDLGVSAFFVLSGFLITWLLLKEWRAEGVSRSAGSMRAGRCGSSPPITPSSPSRLPSMSRGTIPGPGVWPPRRYVYVVNYYNALHNHPGTSIAHAWSLGVEEQFYFVWPTVFLLLARRGSRTLLRVLVGLIAVVLLWRSSLVLARVVGSAYVYNAFDTRFDNLGVGCLLAVCAEQPWAPQRVGPGCRSAPSHCSCGREWE